MYNVYRRDECSSPDMDITSSFPNNVNKQITISYENMPYEKTSGYELTVTCEGFRNPISLGEWPGFHFQFFDSEPIPASIEVSDSVSMFTDGYLPAEINAANLNIQPSIVKIAEFSVWTVTLTEFPIPLNTGCFVELIIPGDLTY